MIEREIRLQRYFLLSLFVIVLVRNAWVSDDAYITFRVIENFLAGYGLTYNPFVRVQAYTHPAWILLLSFLYFLERLVIPSAPNALYFITIFVSILLSVWTLSIAIQKIVQPNFLISVFVVSAFLFSRAYMDFSTSGLENPLSHFLLVLFLWLYLKEPAKILNLTLVSSLLVLTRHDLLLPVMPALAYIYWLNRKQIPVLRTLIIGLSPFILWEAFSTFYYGFPFPNTAYAKLNTGVEPYLLFEQGFDYLLNSLHWDPLTLLITAFAGFSVFSLPKESQERNKLLWLYSGVVLYLLYVVKIGGDFMSGRFLTVPFFISVLVVSVVSQPRKMLLMVTGVVILLGVFSVRSTLLDPRFPSLLSWSLAWDNNEIADERSVYFSNAEENIYLGFIEGGLRNADVGSGFAGKKWYFTGTRKIMEATAIGRIGYTKGPNIYMVDHEALSDPLLARLPTHQIKWRIGHFGRDFPEGYMETLESGENQIQDVNLALYYDALNSVVQGPLWDWNRFMTIWKLNTGQYDYLVQKYIEARAEQ